MEIGKTTGLGPHILSIVLAYNNIDETQYHAGHELAETLSVLFMGKVRSAEVYSIDPFVLQVTWTTPFLSKEPNVAYYVLPRITQQSKEEKRGKKIKGEIRKWFDPIRTPPLRVWTCQTCFGEQQGDSLFGGRCDTGQHEYCRSCLQSWLETKLATADPEPRLFCAANSCTSRITLQCNGLWLSKPLYLAWEHALAIQSVSHAALTYLKTCPKCRVFGVEVLPEDAKILQKRLVCLRPECKYVSCLDCKAPYHGVSPCDTSMVSTLASRVSTPAERVRIRVEECLSRHRVRSCPACSTEFVRQDGCNHMTCSACGKDCCYVCLMPADKRIHFHDPKIGPGPDALTCPLYSNEEHIAKMAFQNALKEMKQWPTDEASSTCLALVRLEPQYAATIREAFPGSNIVIPPQDVGGVAVPTVMGEAGKEKVTALLQRLRLGPH